MQTFLRLLTVLLCFLGLNLVAVYNEVAWATIVLALTLLSLYGSFKIGEVKE